MKGFVLSVILLSLAAGLYAATVMAVQGAAQSQKKTAPSGAKAAPTAMVVCKAPVMVGVKVEKPDGKGKCGAGWMAVGGHDGKVEYCEKREGQRLNCAPPIHK